MIVLSRRRSCSFNLCFLVAFVLLLFWNFSGTLDSENILKDLWGSSSLQVAEISSPCSQFRYAYATLLTKNDDADPYDDESDWYFQMVRTLIFKLIHDPKTKSEPVIPFIVLVTKDYELRKRRRLEAYGAEVREIKSIDVDWIEPLLPRWHSVMDKLRLFQMTEFEKILFIDADHMILRRLDGVFDSVNATAVGQDSSQVEDDEAPLPDEYLLAARPELPADHTHEYPPAEDDPNHAGFGNLNAGFMLLMPSQALFEYYMSVASIEHRFDAGFPEQHLLAYAHRQDGNMPWRHLDWHWNVNWGRFDDVREGVHSFHQRFQMTDYDWGLKGDVELQKLWWGEANMARGYFLGRGIDTSTSNSSAQIYLPKGVQYE